MNKAQIKAELRRSACEDEKPWSGLSYDVWHLVLWQWCGKFEFMDEMAHDNNRTFFLLVAEAL